MKSRISPLRCIFIGIETLALLGMFILYLFFEEKYSMAMDLYNNSKYEEAEIVFAQIGNFKGSHKMVNACEYRTAIELLNNSEYEAAKDIFRSLESFEDSEMMINECDYVYARELLEQYHCNQAKEIFAGLNGYRDSDNMVIECDYVAGLSAAFGKKYEEAKTIFQGLGDYKESREKALMCDYQIAHDLSRQDKKIEARTIFLSLGDYRDSAERALNLTYEITDDYIDARDFENAMIELGKYSNKTEYAYGLFRIEMIKSIDLVLEGRYDEAGEILAGLITDGEFLDRLFDEKYYISNCENVEIRSPYGNVITIEMQKEYCFNVDDSSFDIGLFFNNEGKVRYDFFVMYYLSDSLSLDVYYDSQGNPYGVREYRKK